MGIYKNNLYVADLSEVVVIDIKKGKITNRIPVEGATFLNDIAVSLFPKNSPLHGPEINQITDNIERLAIKSSQESEQCIGLRATGSKMDIRDPYAPVVIGGYLMHNIMCRQLSFGDSIFRL